MIVISDPLNSGGPLSIKKRPLKLEMKTLKLGKVTYFNEGGK